MLLSSTIFLPIPPSIPILVDYFHIFLDTLSIHFSKKLVAVLSDHILALLTVSTMVGFSTSYTCIICKLIEEILLDY